MLRTSREFAFAYCIDWRSRLPVLDGQANHIGVRHRVQAITSGRNPVCPGYLLLAGPLSDASICGAAVTDFMIANTSMPSSSARRSAEARVMRATSAEAPHLSCTSTCTSSDTRTPDILAGKILLALMAT